MLKIHVLTVKTCNPVVYRKELFNIIENKFLTNISNNKKGTDTIKIIFSTPISFSDIEELAKKLQSLEGIHVKEMKWKFEKINGITGFLDMVVS